MSVAGGFFTLFCFCLLGRCCSLRHQWTGRQLHSPVAKQLQVLHDNCKVETPNHLNYGLNNYGMGSSIGVCLVKATCNSLQLGSSLRTVATGAPKKWIWTDEEFCGKQVAPYDNDLTNNPLQCYFGNVFSPCLNETSDNVDKAESVWWQTWKCPLFIPHIGNFSSVWDFSSAATEYMFSQVNPMIVKRAEEEAIKIFGPKGSPSNMITVHIRWGDKKHEMGGSLVPMDNYINAVKFFIKKHHLKEVNIFLTTEDPVAARAFKNHDDVVAGRWTVYEYKAAISPNSATHTPALDAKNSKGKFGLISMIVLLLSMESQYYVLTTASNWSVLIQSLANSVVKQSGVGMDYIDLRRNPLSHKQQHSFNTRHKRPLHHPYNKDGVLVFPLGSSIQIK